MFATGAGFYALFGLGWWLSGAGAISGAASIVAVVAGAVATAGLLFLAWRRTPAGTGGPPFTERGRRRFLQVNVVQWVLILTVVLGCVRLGAPEFIPPLVAFVVGVHFLPLAGVFGRPALRVPAALLIAAGGAGLAVWLGGGSAESVRLVVGVAAALSLWGTGVWTVMAVGAAARASADR
ncbi:hypothetical protein [Streptomyces zingiberis]|uniref:Sensor histidine kinase n=1 Tax=Streptomyces zingiberis TaxID=2053010 RepID=A0ABX1BQA2_9ACTN|nr:hypothetical protein [Streptomyces zingiberis]NJP99865.1 hypothetical protein [Streptomyces zingiberis]